MLTLMFTSDADFPQGVVLFRYKVCYTPSHLTEREQTPISPLSHDRMTLYTG